MKSEYSLEPTQTHAVVRKAYLSTLRIRALDVWQRVLAQTFVSLRAMESTNFLRAVGALLGAGISCLIWWPVETVALIRTGESAVRSVFAVAAAGFASILFFSILSFFAAVFFSSALGRKILLPGLPARIKTGSYLGFLATGSFAYAGYYVTDALFSGQAVKAIAIGISTSVFLAVAFATGYWAVPAFASAWTKRLPPLSSRSIALILGILTVVWISSFFAIEKEVYVAIEPLSYWPLALTLVLSLTGAFRAPKKRWVAISATTSFLLFGSLFVLHWVFPGTRYLTERVRETTVASRVFYALVPDFSPVRKKSVVANNNLPTCRPGEVLPQPSDIPRAKKGAPDIVWVTVDALRWDHTSLDNYERDTTPNLKRRAKKAAVFSRAYTPSNSTRQTFPGLFTGLFRFFIEDRGSDHKGWGPSVPANQPTLAGYLNKAGFQTITFVAWKPIFTKKSNILNGFDRIDFASAIPFRKLRFAAPYQIDSVIGALSEYSPERPRFIWTHLPEPHQPYRSGPRPVVYGNNDIDRYDAAFHFVDGELERLVAFALSPARKDNTVLILSGDHGQAFGEHGTQTHGASVYQEETRTPLLFFGPNLVPRLIDNPVSQIDIFPTILDLAGLPAVGALCGQSLAPVLYDANTKPEREVFIQVIPDHKGDDHNLALVYGTHKVVVFPKTGKRELYDIAEDPKELTNLAAREPGKLDEMIKKMNQYLRAHGMENPTAGESTVNEK